MTAYTAQKQDANLTAPHVLLNDKRPYKKHLRIRGEASGGCDRPCCVRKNARSLGYYYRKSDKRNIKRYRCKTCGRSFSSATNHPCKYQKKRHLNELIMALLASNMSIRRIALLLDVSTKTVMQKLIFMAGQCEQRMHQFLPRNIQDVQIDELHTFEHTKAKPLSIIVAICKKTRRILGFKVSTMPASGRLAKISTDKYGPRKDNRQQGLKSLLQNIKTMLHTPVRVQTDQCPYYPKPIRVFLDDALHQTFKGRKSRNYGQGELKEGGYDPLFSINHTFAMKRANINRLIRKTWCTTKKTGNLQHHLMIYAFFHNSMLTSA